MKMFSVFTAIAVTCMAFVMGCKSIPSEETIRGTAESIGRAAGYAVELGKTKNEVKESIINVLDVAAKVVPETNQTFIATWKPLIDDDVAKLIAAGKLKDEDAALVKNALYVACDGVDLVFTRYPKAREYKNLVSAATGGFVTGFKSVVSFTAGERAGYDNDAYKILRNKFEGK